MNKDLLKRLDQLLQKNAEPVKIWNLYRMPDGSERRMRWKGDDQHSQMKEWEEQTGAKLIDIIIEVEER